MLLKVNTKFKIYLHMKSFYYYYLLRDIKFFFLNIKKKKIQILNKKIIFLPIKIQKFSVVKSPFVSKLAKEQFEIRIYKVLLILYFKNNLPIKFFKTNLIVNFKHVYYKFSHIINI